MLLVFLSVYRASGYSGSPKGARDGCAALQTEQIKIKALHGPSGFAMCLVVIAQKVLAIKKTS